MTDSEEWVLRKIGTVTLQKAGLVPTEGGIRARDAVESFLRCTDKPLAASADAMTQGLSHAFRNRLNGIGRGTSPESLQTKRCGEFVVLDRAEEGVWINPAAVSRAAHAAGRPSRSIWRTGSAGSPGHRGHRRNLAQPRRPDFCRLVT